MFHFTKQEQFVLFLVVVLLLLGLGGKYYRARQVSFAPGLSQSRKYN